MLKGREGLGTMLGIVTSVSWPLWKPSLFSASQYKQQCSSHISYRGGPADGLLCTTSPWAQRNGPSTWEHPQPLQMAAKEHLKCLLCNCCCHREVPGWGRLEMLSSTWEGRTRLMRQPNWEIKMNVQYTAHGVWFAKDPTSSHGKSTCFELA